MSVTTFKSFVNVDSVKKKAKLVAAQLLGVDHVRETSSAGNLTSSNEVSHKFIDTKDGPWVAAHLRKRGAEVVKVSPPRGLNCEPFHFEKDDEAV